MLRNADYYLLSGLVQRSSSCIPSVRVRLIGLNSVDVAAAVADGDLEAGLVVLPIDPAGLQVTPWARDEVFYVSADPARPPRRSTIASWPGAAGALRRARRLARPDRRQLPDRAHLAGVRLEPWIEVEQVETALNLVARGVGDTIVSRAVRPSRLLGGPARDVLRPAAVRHHRVRPARVRAVVARDPGVRPAGPDDAARQ